MEITENQAIINQFEKLEKRIEQLIRSLASQEETNLELVKKIESLERELRKRIDLEQRYSKERMFIRSNVDNLLTKLEDILNVM